MTDVTSSATPLSVQPDVASSLREGEVSPYTLMRSQAGYYVGTQIMREGCLYPHSRISDYMSAKAAAAWLDNGIKNQSI